MSLPISALSNPNAQARQGETKKKAAGGNTIGLTQADMDGIGGKTTEIVNDDGLNNKDPFEATLRKTFRKIVGCPNEGKCKKEADDDKLGDWLCEESYTGCTMYAPTFDKLHEELGDGIGVKIDLKAENKTPPLPNIIPGAPAHRPRIYIPQASLQPASIWFLLDAQKPMPLLASGDLRRANAALASMNMPQVSDTIYAMDYVKKLRLQMDGDENGKVNEDEFVNHFKNNRHVTENAEARKN